MHCAPTWYSRTRLVVFVQLLRECRLDSYAHTNSAPSIHLLGDRLERLLDQSKLDDLVDFDSNQSTDCSYNFCLHSLDTNRYENTIVCVCVCLCASASVAEIIRLRYILCLASFYSDLFKLNELKLSLLSPLLVPLPTALPCSPRFQLCCT